MIGPTRNIRTMYQEANVCGICMWFDPCAFASDDLFKFGTCDLDGMGQLANCEVFECHGYRRKPEVPDAKSD